MTESGPHMHLEYVVQRVKHGQCCHDFCCAGGLTQFHLLEDSAPATQTQRAVTDAITKSTLSMIGYAIWSESVTLIPVSP